MVESHRSKDAPHPARRSRSDRAQAFSLTHRNDDDHQTREEGQRRWRRSESQDKDSQARNPNLLIFVSYIVAPQTSLSPSIR